MEVLLKSSGKKEASGKADIEKEVFIKILQICMIKKKYPTWWGPSQVINGKCFSLNGSPDSSACISSHKIGQSEYKIEC